MKKIIIVVAIIALLVSCGIVYLNQVVLPQKLKALIIKGIEGSVQKKVSLESLRFHIFKGLVLRGLAVYDGKEAILKVREVSCTFFILPFFKKQIVIPSLRIKSPVLFLERRQDNSFNISGMFPEKSGILAGKSGKDADGSGFRLLVSKISVTGGRIDFRDNTLSPAFNGQADKINLVAYLSLPAKVKFSLRCDIPRQAGPVQAAKIEAAGEYNIVGRSMSANVTLKDLSVSEFDGYYRSFGVSLPEGSIDAKVAVNIKDDVLAAVLDGQAKAIRFSKDKINGRINSSLKASGRYSFGSRQFDYSGSLNVFDTELSGIETIGKINGIKGEIKFSPAGISSDSLTAGIFGLPFEIKAKLSDFSNPVVNLNAVSEAGVDSILSLLKDRFAFSPPVDATSGRGKLSFTVDYQARAGAAMPAQINGTFDIVNTALKLKDSGAVIASINGLLKFGLNRLEWEGINFNYLGIDYRMSGTLIDFKAPAVQLKLVSRDLTLESAFSFTGKKAVFSNLFGRYLDSEFSLSGEVDFSNPSAAVVDAAGKLKIDLKDTKGPLKKFKARLDKIDPKGGLQIKGKFSGNIKDIKSCLIEAQASSDSLSLYGLKPDGFSMDYRQDNGIAEIALMRLSLYGGYVDLTGKMNLKSENLPYWINANAQGVKIEKLKDDTALRDKDIAGTIQAQVKINGFSNDLARLSGAGTVIITEGKLWQLNLFKGIGALLFTSDFTNVVFNEGSCGFTIQDKYVYTDNLRLRSNLTNISGEAKIGFDGSLDASLDAEVLPEAPLSGTVKDITTAVLGQATRIGVIRVTGSLKEPKFKFKPAVAAIIKGIKDMFFNK
jgi:hypothetical protein